MEKDLEDTFLTTTSTKTDLDSTSFLSSLDMDPQLTGYTPGAPGGSLLSPAGSKISLPSGPSAAEGIFHSLSAGGISTQSSSGPATGSSIGDGVSGRGGPGEPKREVFSDLKRFVTFGLRKDSSMQ